MKPKGEVVVFEVTLTDRDAGEFLLVLDQAADEGLLQDPFEVKRVEDE